MAPVACRRLHHSRTRYHVRSVRLAEGRCAVSFSDVSPPSPWAVALSRREFGRAALAGATMCAAGPAAAARAAAALPPGDADIRYVARLVNDPALDSVYA